MSSLTVPVQFNFSVQEDCVEYGRCCGRGLWAEPSEGCHTRQSSQECLTCLYGVQVHVAFKEVEQNLK